MADETNTPSLQSMILIYPLIQPIVHRSFFLISVKVMYADNHGSRLNVLNLAYAAQFPCLILSFHLTEKKSLWYCVRLKYPESAVCKFHAAHHQK